MAGDTQYEARIVSPYMTVEEAARYMRQQPVTVKRWHKTGKLKGIRTHANILFTAVMCDDFLMQRYEENQQKRRTRRRYNR